MDAIFALRHLVEKHREGNVYRVYKPSEGLRQRAAQGSMKMYERERSARKIHEVDTGHARRCKNKGTKYIMVTERSCSRGITLGFSNKPVSV